MKMRIRGVLVFLCCLLLSLPAEALDANLNGRWVSLQYGSLTFSQVGDTFTAVWTGTKAEGTISGSQASFRFWAGASFDICKDDSRGYGTLTLSDDGNTLNGTWASLSKAEPESGSFIAVRLSSISGLMTQEAAIEIEESTNPQSMATEPLPQSTAPTAGTDSQQSITVPQTSAVSTLSATEQPDELILLPESLPAEYTGPIAEAIAALEESVLKIFGIFDDDSGIQTDTVPPPDIETVMPEETPLQNAGDFWDFFTDLWSSLWGG